MKRYHFTKSTLLLPLLLVYHTITAQSLNQYLPPVQHKIVKPVLKDTLHIEVFFPRERKLSPIIPRPVIYLFDRQNTGNYKYTLQTIDYLTSMNSMPAAVIVGVKFPAALRTKWTLPTAQNGMADSLLSYLLGAFRTQLSRQCKLADFNLLIGHSRTAMLSQYALAAFPKQVNAVIASSNSFFDFNTASQKELFEKYITQLLKPGTPRYLFFSSGIDSFGDTHETSVNQLKEYLSAKQWPSRFHWQAYTEPTSHMSTPGLTNARALNDLFSPANKALQKCFAVLNKPNQTDSVPWQDYEAIWQEVSKKIGFELQPSITFFNSLASGYYNDYDNHYKQSNLKLATIVLEKAVQFYPKYPGFYSFRAAVALEMGELETANQWLAKSQIALKHLKECTPAF